MKLLPPRNLPIIESLFALLVVAGFVVADARVNAQPSPTAATPTPPTRLEVPRDHYVATDGTIDPIADARPYTGAAWPTTGGRSGMNRVGVFVDLSGSEANKSTPVGEVAYNDIGRWITDADDFAPLAEFARQAGAFLGSDEPAVLIYRYPTGGYGCRLPGGGGKLHAPLARMMSSPWLDGPNAERNLAAMMHLCEQSRAAGIDFAIYFGTAPINDRFVWWDAEGLIKCAKLAADLGACALLYDWISGAESISGKPIGAQNWANGGTWPNAPTASEDARTVIKVPARVEGVADKFMLSIQAARPDIPHIAESLREPGRAMYAKVGGLRMIFPGAQSDGRDRCSATKADDIKMLLADAWQRQVLNPGVPIVYHLDGDWTNKADEMRATLAVLRSLPSGDGGPIITATCWSLIQCGGPKPPMKKAA